MVVDITLARSVLVAIASAADTGSRALARLDWRLAVVAGTLVGSVATLAAITFAVSPISIALWLAVFAALALLPVGQQGYAESSEGGTAHDGFASR